MKMVMKSIGAVFTGIALMASGQSAMAQVSAANSKHNLSSTGGQAQSTSATNDQVCVYCHTPHGGDVSVANVPLWNKNLPAGPYTVYSTANSTTMDGEVIATVASVSLACLSCHDGTQAMDAVLNQPGTGANPGNIDAGVTMTGVANLTQDLSNDHPIGVQYAGGGCGGVAGDCTAANFQDEEFNTAQQDTIGGTPVWWVDAIGGTANARDKTDMILYTRTDFTDTTPQPSVECASCHDPHNSTVVANQVQFLRTPNTGSAVCTTCHIK